MLLSRQLFFEFNQICLRSRTNLSASFLSGHRQMQSSRFVVPFLEIRINAHVCGAGQANGHDYGPSLLERVHENAALPAPLDVHGGDAGPARACVYVLFSHGDAYDHASR
jgi:hypothetical protein